MEDLVVYHSEFKLNVTRNISSSSPASSPATTATGQTSVIEDSLKHTLPQQQEEELGTVQGDPNTPVEVINMLEQRIYNTRKRGRAQDEEVINPDNHQAKKQKVQSEGHLPEHAEKANVNHVQTLSSSRSDGPSTDLTSDDLDRSTAHVSDKTIATAPLRSSPPLRDRSGNINISSNDNLVDDEITKKTSIIGFDKNGPRNQGRSSAKKSHSISSRGNKAKSTAKQNTSPIHQAKTAFMPSATKSPAKNTSEHLSNVIRSLRGNIADTNEDALAGFLDQPDDVTSTSARAETSTAITNIPSAFVSAATTTSPSPAILPPSKARAAIIDRKKHFTKGAILSDIVHSGMGDIHQAMPSIDLGAYDDQAEHGDAAQNVRDAVRDNLIIAPPAESAVAFNQSKISEDAQQVKRVKTRPIAASKRASKKQDKITAIKTTYAAALPADLGEMIEQSENSRQQRQVLDTPETSSAAIEVHDSRTVEQKHGSNPDPMSKMVQTIHAKTREELAPHHRDLLDRFVEVAEHLVSRLARNENVIRSLIDECWHKGQLHAD